MENMRGTTNFRNSICTGKQSFLPPKSPFPSLSPAYADLDSNSCRVSKGIPRPRERNRHHQHTSSESFLIDEQPSWLDDLLNEPETPARKGAHRRSSSDSPAHMDASNITSKINNLAMKEYKCVKTVPSRGSQEFDYCKDVMYQSNLPLARDVITHRSPGSSGALREPDVPLSIIIEKHDQEECERRDLKGCFESKEGLHANNAQSSQSETDPKRVKQQFAQRSRVRKLQYIAELERNVQVLLTEGSEVSAELEFMDQQNLILSLENKALQQRLDSLAQEQLIKHLQQEMLEREIARLQALYQQQQQPPPTHTHGRRRSRDLDAQFANLSLKHTDTNSGQNPVTGTLHI